MTVTGSVLAVPRTPSVPKIFPGGAHRETDSAVGREDHLNLFRRHADEGDTRRDRHLDTLAEVHLRLGQPARAVEFQKQAIELEPESLDLTERLKKRPDIASWFTTPAPDSSKMMIEEDENTSKPEGVPPPANLNGYGVPSAVALVEGEHTLSTLEMWQKIEQRPQVVEALRRKIESMGGGTATRAFMENEIERRANERAAEILEQQTAPAKTKKQ